MRCEDQGHVARAKSISDRSRSNLYISGRSIIHVPGLVMALLNSFLSRISSLVNQVASCLEQEQPSTDTLRGFHSQLHSSLQQLSRIRGTVEDGEYTQLRDNLQVGLKLIKNFFFYSR